MTAASGTLGWFMSGRVLGPVRMITQTARRASEQHLGERLALTGARDERRELADTFDDMLHRLDTAFAAQRRFVASASHELRTPLTLMRTAIDVTLAKPSPTTSQLSEMATRIRRSIDRAETMIEALLTLAISDQGTLRAEFTDLATCAEDALDAAAPQIEKLGLHLDTSFAPAETSADPQLLDRVVSNLIDNAIRHNQPGGWIKLSTGSTDSTACLQIANSGLHVPYGVIPRSSSRSSGCNPGPAPATALASACLSPSLPSPPPRHPHRPQPARWGPPHNGHDPTRFQRGTALPDGPPASVLTGGAEIFGQPRSSGSAGCSIRCSARSRRP